MRACCCQIGIILDRDLNSARLYTCQGCNLLLARLNRQASLFRGHLLVGVNSVWTGAVAADEFPLGNA